MAQTSNKRLIFVAGVEGSGTTLMRRLLAAPDCCACIGRDITKLPDHPDAQLLLAAFEALTKTLWDRARTLEDHERTRQEWQRLATAITTSPAFAGVTHVVLKRSYPFGGAFYRFCPDLWDLLDLPFEPRVVAVYRDPCAATYSAFRRGFDTDLYRLAVRCANFLGVLAGQLRAIEPAQRHLLSYAALCGAPDRVLARLAQFCDLPEAPLQAAAAAEGLLSGADRRYADELPAADVAWLEGFFDARRRAQWDLLERAA